MVAVDMDMNGDIDLRGPSTCAPSRPRASSGGHRLALDQRRGRDHPHHVTCSRHRLIHSHPHPDELSSSRGPGLPSSEVSAIKGHNHEATRRFESSARSRLVYLLVPLVILHLVIPPSLSLQIPDQQAFVGKLYYYRLPLSREELETIASIEITETTSGSAPGLPEWLTLRRESSKMELLGLPSLEHKRMHFFHLKLIKHDETRTDDVFVVDVIEGPPALSPGAHPKECILRITPSFSSINDVWRVVSYLMPGKLQELEDADQHQRFHRNDGESPTALIQQWVTPLFTLSKVQEEEGFKYQVTIDEQECDKKRRPLNGDDFELKLRKMGIDFNLIKIIRSTLLFDESHDIDDFDNQLLAATKVWSKSVPMETEGYFRRHNRRQANIQPTPSLGQHWATVTYQPTIDEGTDDPTQSLDMGDILTRVVPSIVSPTVTAPESTAALPLRPGQHVNNIRHNNHRFSPMIYTTPSLYPEPPSVIENGDAEGLAPTPTPTFVFTVTQREVETAEVVSPVVPISPSPTFREEPTRTPDEGTTPEEKEFPPLPPSTSQPEPVVPPTTSEPQVPPTTEKEYQPVTPPGKVPNSSPTVHQRVKKLPLIAGKYWKYQIPMDTFYDFEDGYTRNLKLGFYLKLGSTLGDVPPSSDYWIQFNNENQFLYAFPTEENIGKHKFALMAIDSSGQMVTEELEIHVRQHPSARNFHHVFTLYQVTWDYLKYPILIEATEKLVRKIATRIYGDSSITPFVIQSIEGDGKGDDKRYTISWSNDSLPAYPCPKKEIHSFYEKLADMKVQSDGIYAAPSPMLNKVLSQDFKVRGVGLRLAAACGGAPATEGPSAKANPVLRNPLDLLQLKMGEIFRYKIPPDMFFSPRASGDSRDLELTMLTIDGHMPSRHGYLGFDVKTQEIYGLALDDKDVGAKEYQIVAREPETGGSTHDAFLVEVIREDTRKETHGFEVTMSVVPLAGPDMDLETRVNLIWRIATEVLKDSDPSAVKVLSFKKYQYTPLAYNNRITRDLIGRSRVARESNSFYYEIIWTNKTKSLSTESGKCPSELINENIVNRLFRHGYSSSHYELLQAPFESDYQLLFVKFKPVGKCSGYISPREVGKQPVAVLPLPTTIPPSGPTTRFPVVNAPNDMDEYDREYYMTTIFPAVATIVAMLIISLIIVIILVRYRRRQEKTRFDISGASRTPGDGFPTERDAFLQKGRVPVIFEAERQQQQQMLAQHQQQFNLYAPVIMPPPPQQPHQHPPPPQQHQMQQMTPMRQLNKGTYQPLASQPPAVPAHQRRQPPPYYK